VGKLTQAVTNHILCDIDRNMTTAIMNGYGVTHHLGEDHARSTPGANNFLVATIVHGFDFLQ